ncbi:MAG TPA: class I SAM-dependent methyltransferase [Acidimicrobiales bacterium]|nr:class I SAM-dependent methyltransferase [Acidimicrobiales bacterium]
MPSTLSRALRRAANRLDQRGVDRRAVARQIVGGAWEEMGQHQFNFLVEQGLQPSDWMLDVGCGALRGGVHFIRYLEPGHYCGIEREQWILDVGAEELADAGLTDRAPVLLCNRDFEFDKFGRQFDVALAQSVFTHIPLNNIHRCLVRMSEALRPGGVFYATFLDNPGDPNDLSPIEFPQKDGPPSVTYPDRDPFRYHVRFFEDLVNGLPLKLEHIGDWGSPRGQSMLAFHKV